MGLTNAQYEEIMRIYQRRQNQDRRELAEREEEVAARIPAFGRIEEQIAEASVACAKEELEDQDGREKHRVASLRARIRDLGETRSRLLEEAGFPKDYLLPQYYCPDCRDTGYIDGEKCHCFKQAEIDLFYTQSDLYENLREENFSSFSLAYYSEELKDPVTGLSAAETARHTLLECRRFVREFDEKFENIFLSGETGLGKTLLSACVAGELQKSMHSVIYFSACRLFDQLTDLSFGRFDEQEAEEFSRQIYTCDLLIIDDLGTERDMKNTASQLFTILNERLLRKKSTLISTNLLPENVVERYSERVLSRILSEYLMLRLSGDDIRLKKKCG